MNMPVLILLAAALLSGCATYQPRPLEPARTAAAFESRTLDNPELKKFLEGNLGREITSWPPKTWDFRLLMLTAFYYNPELDVARAQWAVAEARKITAGQRPNPSFGFTPQHHSRTAGGLSPWTLGFNLDIPIETAGKRGYRIARAGSLTEAARLNIATVAWKVRSRLRTGLLDLYAAGRAETLLRREQSVRAELVKALRRRLDLGEVSRPDVTQAEISLAQAAVLLRETQRQKAEARVRVADALGLPVTAIEGITLSPDIFAARLPPPPPREARRQALLNRSDILALLAEYEASQAALQLEIAKQYPDIHLGPGYQWDQGDNKWSLGFSVTMPILNRNRGPIAEAEARRKETAARFDALQAAVIGEIDLALRGYRAAVDKLETAEGLLLSQKNRWKSVEALFAAGETDRLTLLSAVLEQEVSALVRQDALVRAERSLGVLEDALQRPLPQVEPLPVNVETDPRPEKENRK